MKRVVYVGLLFNYVYTFYRDVLLGVRQFAETRPDWIFLPVFVGRRKLRWNAQAPPHGILATVDNPAFASALESWGGPVVTVGGGLPGLAFPRVAADNLAVGRLAAEHFLERQITNFAFVGHKEHLTSQEREAAYRAALGEAGCGPVHCYHAPRPFDPRARHWFLDSRIQPWLLALPKPIGVFVPGDIFGTALTQICREIGVRIPEDVALLGVDNDHVFGRLAHPALSSVLSNAEQIGHEAAALLDRLIAGQMATQATIRVAPLGIQTRRSSEMLAIDDEDVVAAARFIRENAQRQITVPDVLRAVNVSRRSLERRFQQALGCGMAQEIRRVRLEHSKRLLSETNLKLPRVAMHAGFSTVRQLGSVFQRELGVSPSQYRRQMQMPKSFDA